MRRRVIEDDLCETCKSFPDTCIHAFWECEATQDVWAGSSIWLQK